jgi:plastocyanin
MAGFQGVPQEGLLAVSTKGNTVKKSIALAFAFAATGLVACGGEKKEGAETEEVAPASSAAPLTPGVETPDNGGKIIVVTLTTEADGTNRFVPAELEAHQGDVLRFTLGVGVHNVNFLPDSNAVKTGLPPASPMLQPPGQTYDIKVTMAEGRYYFQCDPHAALGMKGHLKVED